MKKNQELSYSNISPRSYKPFITKLMNLTYLTFHSLILLLGIIIPSYKYLPKGEDYVKRSFARELILSLSFIVVIIFFNFFVNIFDTTLFDIPIAIFLFLTKPLFEVLKIILNYETDENGNYFIFSPALLTSKQYKVFNESYKKVNNQMTSEKELIKNIPIFKNKVKEMLFNDVIKLRSKLHNSSNIYECISPLIDSSQFKKMEVYLSNNNLIFFPKPEDVVDYFISQHDLNMDNHYKIKSELGFNYKEFFEIPYLEIPISSISEYSIFGSINHVTKVKGGGSSIGGAIIGGLIAGDAGAIIGSRKSIKSEIVKIDERVIKLIYLKGKKKVILNLAISTLEALENLIPNKFSK